MDASQRRLPPPPPPLLLPQQQQQQGTPVRGKRRGIAMNGAVAVLGVVHPLSAIFLNGAAAEVTPAYALLSPEFAL